MKKSTPINTLSSPIHYKYYLLLLVIVVLVFGNTIRNDYNMDDNLVTQHHPLTSSKRLSTIVDIFKTPYYIDNMGYSYGYRPIVTLSFFIEHFFFGENVGVSHFFNLLLYATTLVLLLKLLLSWLGEKGAIISLLAIIFFTVHPAHSEVVASIKNRDEILALLFIVLAGLAILKYLSRDNWGYLFFIFVFSLLAILSKKSIYSMVLILPVATIIFKEVNSKQLILFSIVLVIPAAIIGSNLKFERAVFLSVIPMGSIFCFYYLRKYIQGDWKLDTKKANILHSFISWAWVAFTIHQHSNFYLILYLGFLLFVLKKNEFWLISQVILQLFTLSFFFDSRDLSLVAMFLSLSFYTHSIIKNKPDKKLLFLAIIISIFNISIYPGISIIPMVLDTFIFFFLTSKRPLWPLLMAILGVIGNISSGIGFRQLLTLAYSIINYKYEKKNGHHIKINSVIIVTIIYLFLSSLPTFQANVKSIFSTDKQINNSSGEIPQVKIHSGKSTFKENRPIGYVENTLIAPHTTIETIGTGFIVIGEYLKLMIFPKELSYYYGYSKIKTTGLNDLNVWLSILAHLSLIVLAIWQFKTRPVLTFGIAWYLISILLFSNWPELVAGMVGERLAFTASAGFSIFMASLIIWIKPNFSFTKPKGIEWVVFSIFILMGVRTVARNAQWKDPITLMSHDIKHLENSAHANNLYAIYLMKESVNPKNNPQVKHKFQLLALQHFKQAVTIYPAFFNANFDIGRVNIELQDFKNAKLAFEQSYKIDPENILVLEELTKTSFDLKQKSDTEFYGNKYIEKDKHNENIHELVAYIMFINNEKVKAKEYAERGLNYFPNNQNLQGIFRESSK